MKPKNICKLIVTMMAAIGCGYQLQSTMVVYFQYLSITRSTYVYSINEIDLMCISVCIPYVDILNYA